MTPSFVLRLLWVFALLASAALATSPKKPAPVLLISLDAFRWDYCDLYPDETPNLRRLRAEGVSAEALVPVFPSQTFASHYSIVTGLRPAKHGIISNRFYDATLGLAFHYKLPNAVRDPQFWGGEPIWNTAVKQGLRSACYFWPGSEVTGPLRPTFTKAYNYSIPFEKRLDELFDWLRLPESERPAIITFYFEETNSSGHYFGIGSPELVAAIKLLDERVGHIVSRAEKENIPLNLVLVSDHGMAPTNGATQTTLIDDYVDLEKTQVDFDGPVAGLRALDGDIDGLLARLTRLPKQFRVFRSDNAPAHLHLTASPRVPEIWILPEPGWRIQLKSAFIAAQDERLKGEHGYDPASPLMHGILIAHGPAFKSGGEVTARVESIHLYNLFCAILGLTPAPNDGDDRLVQALLAP